MHDSHDHEILLAGTWPPVLFFWAPTLGNRFHVGGAAHVPEERATCRR
jgi:hypothetical protein